MMPRNASLSDGCWPKYSRPGHIHKEFHAPSSREEIKEKNKGKTLNDFLAIALPMHPKHDANRYKFIYFHSYFEKDRKLFIVKIPVEICQDFD